MNIKILIPVFNDWESLNKLLEEINLIINGLGHNFSVLIINDASTESRSENLLSLDNFQSVKVINMRENRGHARCNAAGLKYILENDDFDYVIPMDGDGEDRPEEIKQFIDNLNYHPSKVIVGERVKRSEGIFFRFCYFVHKIITFVFTGQSIKFGNYTFLPKLVVQKMIDEKATWSSFSGSLAKIEKDRATVPSIRGSRYFGPTKMNFKSLLIHSLSIIGVFKISLIIRSILFSLVYFFLISENISIITLVPIFLIIILVILTLLVSKRENMEEFNNSLSNINNIEKIK
tara:strand:- start:1537 stop:2406 length:870 start_codon:yes stop_codon:yes gene_type:complete